MIIFCLSNHSYVSFTVNTMLKFVVCMCKFPSEYYVYIVLIYSHFTIIVYGTEKEKEKTLKLF